MPTTVIIECISWLIKVTDNNDAGWKPEIDLCRDCESQTSSKTTHQCIS